MPVSPARAAAYQILLRVERESSYASELLHVAAYERLSARDHALATELVLGVLRWQSRLDEDLARASAKPLSRLDLEILLALRLGIYQLRCLDRVPVRAALFESVELVKRAQKRSAAPFVNAVLRKAAERTARYLPALTNHGALSTVLMAQELAHPPWLVARWAKEYGFSNAQKICEYDQSVPKTTIRLRMTGLESELEQDGITTEPSSLLASARTVVTGDITKTRAFLDGRAVVQDQASQLVALLVAGRNDHRSPWHVLDCCAAPGGKTLAISDRNPAAQIVAVELHPHRARLLKKRLMQADVPGKVRVLVANSESLPISSAFDRVLADVPCSGTGTLARNPEIKWRLRPEDISNLQARQVTILRSAMDHVRPGGRVVYSTCSLEPEENEAVVEQLLMGNSSFRLLDCRPEIAYLKDAGELVWSDIASLSRGPYLRTLPGAHPCDGFFAAILEKTS